MLLKKKLLHFDGCFPLGQMEGGRSTWERLQSSHIELIEQSWTPRTWPLQRPWRAIVERAMKEVQTLQGSGCGFVFQGEFGEYIYIYIYTF